MFVCRRRKKVYHYLYTTCSLSIGVMLLLCKPHFGRFVVTATSLFFVLHVFVSFGAELTHVVSVSMSILF